MSENIPLEIQMEIVERIREIKWVIQSRSVSKLWKSRIDSKEFVAAHTRRHSNDDNHHLLVMKKDYGHAFSGTKCEYESIVDDDDSFPHGKRKLLVSFPVKKSGSEGGIIVDGCRGLICFDAYPAAVVWNPSIRKSVTIKLPYCQDKDRQTLGFGVCRSTLDPKLVNITHVFLGPDDYVITSTYVEVYTLGSVRGTWRSPLSSNFPHKSIEIEGYSRAVVNGVIYWNAVVDRIFAGTEIVSTNHRYLIMSFDFTSEEFAQVNLPDHLALNPDALFSLYNVRESLVVIEFDDNHNNVLWMMVGHGCFNKLYSFATKHSVIFGFRKNGAPIIEYEDDNLLYPVGMFEPESKNITEFATLKDTSFVHSYKETLLLLGH